MKATQIPFQKTGFFSKIIIDYIERSKDVEELYHHYPDFDGFAKQIQEKKEAFPKSHREVLSKTLSRQYIGFDASEATLQNIQALLDEDTLTVTTGHQLNLFTGPLYFLYKIISTINLCESLKKQFPHQHFVPIYWMATEDHDFDEINFFNIGDQKIVWERPDGGPVGRFSTEGLDRVFELFSTHVGSSQNANDLKELFQNAYLNHPELSSATRYISNELFKAYGLVIVDADDAHLKKLFVPVMKDELLRQTSFHSVSKTVDKIKKKYKVQVHPREINLFYLTDSIRERITKEAQGFKVLNTDLSFTEKALLELLEEHPDRFSPNVIMRPLYQEVILPNLCYIGGGGELAYWLELKEYFNTVNMPFPVLLLRNSVQVISAKQAKNLEKLDISYEELFLKQEDLLAKKVTENSEIQFRFSDAQALLEQQFLTLQAIAEKTDFSFSGAVKAQQAKQLKGLKNLQKRLLRAEKRQQAHLVDRIINLQNQLLPHKILEERYRNFSVYYLEYGSSFIATLKENLHPLELAFTILVA